MPRPSEAPEEDEIFVRLSFHDQEPEPVMAFTMPVSGLLHLLYSMAADAREIVQNDAAGWPFVGLNPN